MCEFPFECLKKKYEYQLVADGPGRMAPPPFGDQIKINGAYRHPALDARGVVCSTEAARIIRDRPARPLTTNRSELFLFRNQLHVTRSRM